MNEAMIAEEVEAIKNEVTSDVKKELTDLFKKTFRGNKYIQFK
jgi:hypothetical protein